MKKKLLSFALEYWPLIFLLMLLFYIARGFAFSDGYIMYGEFFASKDYLFFLKEFLKPWSGYSGLGHSNIGFPGTYGNPNFFVTPVGLLIPWVAVFAFFQLFLGDAVSKFYTLAVVSIPFIGMYYFSKHWFSKYVTGRILLQLISFSSALIYTFNDLIGDRVYAGHLFYNLAYGLFPLYLLFFFKSLDDKTHLPRNTVILGWITASFICFMPHLIVIALIPLTLYILLFVFPNIHIIKTFIFQYIITIFLGFLFLIHAWLPSLFFSERYPFLTDSTHLTSFLYNTARTVTFDKILTLTGSYIPYLSSKEEYTSLFISRLILPLLGILGVIYYRNKKHALFLFLIAVFGVVFGMGINFPFHDMYVYLYEHITPFKIFRDSSKFIILYVFSLSLSIPILFILLQKYIQYLTILVLAFFVYFIFAINPLFNSGNFSDNVKAVTIPHKYEELNHFFSQINGDFRVAIYPNNKATKEYTWFPEEKIGPIFPTVFTIFSPLSKNIAMSNKVASDYPSRYLEFIENNITSEWAIRRLGSDAHVKYIVVDYDLPDSELLVQELSKNKELKKEKGVEGFEIYKITSHQEARSRKNVSAYYFGDVKGYQYIREHIALIDMGFNDISVLKNNTSDVILLYNASLYDMFYSSLKDFSADLVRTAKFSSLPFTEFLPKGESMLYESRNGINIYNPEAVFTAGKGKIEHEYELLPGKYKVFVRTVMNDNPSNNYRLKIGDWTTENKTSSRSGSMWTDIGTVQLTGNSKIEIENLEEKYLIIDYLLIIPDEIYKKKNHEFQTYIAGKKTITVKNTALNVNDFGNKMIYVESRSYSPHWEVCGGKSSPLQVNYFALGYECDFEEKESYFKPTVLYYASHIISLIFLSGSILLFFTLKRD